MGYRSPQTCDSQSSILPFVASVTDKFCAQVYIQLFPHIVCSSECVARCYTASTHTHPIHLFLSGVSIKQVDYTKSKSSHMAEQNNAAASSSDSGLPFVFPTENDTNCLQLEEQVEWTVQIWIWEGKWERESKRDRGRERERGRHSNRCESVWQWANLK